MNPRDFQGTTFEFFFVVVKLAFGTNYKFTVYGFSENGSEAISTGAFNRNTESLLKALQRYGFRPSGNTGAIARDILAAGDNYDGLTFTVKTVN